MNIAVAGMGYVGLSLSAMMAKHHEVTVVDVVPEKVTMLNGGICPIVDSEIEEELRQGHLKLTATLDARSAYESAEIVFIGVPTDYDPNESHFDTSHVEDVIEQVIAVNPKALIVIKSTVPVGYTESLSLRYKSIRILFSPEFLREGRALHDNLNPSRIIVGHPKGSCGEGALEGEAKKVAELLRSCAISDEVSVLIMGSTEAEAVKLFANTYLALRVSFFNELDSYCSLRNLDSRDIIHGVCADSRIGDYYNNPSFGYGGYCLPKDSKQLLASYDDVPQRLISAVVESNATRKDFIAGQIVSWLKNRKTEQAGAAPAAVGVYRLAMKAGSDNFRQSSVLGVIERLVDLGVCVLVFEPECNLDTIAGAAVTHDLKRLKDECDLVISNRYSHDLDDIASRVFTRDLFCRD